MKYLKSINELLDSKEIERQLEIELEDDYLDNIIEYILVGTSSTGYWVELNIKIPNDLTFSKAIYLDYLINQLLKSKMEKFCRKYNYELLSIKPAATGNNQIHAQIRTN
jgi:hypothetical protein